MIFQFWTSFLSGVFKDNTNTNGRNQHVIEKKDNQGKTLYQIFICTGPLLLTCGVGTMMGFSGIFLPQLKNNNSVKKTDIAEIDSWIASSAVIPMGVTALLGGFLMEKIGRKWTHILSSVPGIVGWITISYSSDITLVVLGRILTGVSCGIISPVTTAYIGETTSPYLRPFISGGIALSVTMGTLLCHLIGTFFTWKTTALFCLVFPVFGSFLTVFSPETPTWLIRKNKIEEACRTFVSVRGNSENNTKEFNNALERHKIVMEGTKDGSLKYFLYTILIKPENYKPFSILVLFFISAQLSGINVVTFYAINIVERSLGKNFEQKYLIMLSMDFIRMVTSIISCILLRKLPRRLIAISGGVGSFACLIILSVSSYLSDNYHQVHKLLMYFPLLALLGYVFFVSVALVALPWCLAGELLPREVKGLASGTLCFISFSVFFIIIKFTPFLFNSLGTHFTYLIFSCSAFFGTALCYFHLPETKNKTLDEISEIYRSEKSGC